MVVNKNLGVDDSAFIRGLVPKLGGNKLAAKLTKSAQEKHFFKGRKACQENAIIISRTRGPSVMKNTVFEAVEFELQFDPAASKVFLVATRPVTSYQCFRSSSDSSEWTVKSLGRVWPVCEENSHYRHDLTMVLTREHQRQTEANMRHGPRRKRQTNNTDNGATSIKKPNTASRDLNGDSKDVFQSDLKRGGGCTQGQLWQEWLSLSCVAFFVFSRYTSCLQEERPTAASIRIFFAVAQI